MIVLLDSANRRREAGVILTPFKTPNSLAGWLRGGLDRGLAAPN
jgi:hypothetical protein